MNKVAVVFPGQGSQYVGMSEDLYNSSSFSKEIFDKARKILGTDILSYSINGPSNLLTSTKIAQPAIFIHSIIIDKILKMNNFKIDAVAGHSLGEYSALVSNDAISLEECIELIKIRCNEMEKAIKNNPGAMIAVIDNNLKNIKKICSNSNDIIIANYNSKNQFVLSGSIKGIELVSEELKKNNVNKIFPLNVSGAFHSHLMNDASHTLNKAINSVNFNDVEIPIYQNVNASPTTNGEKMKKNLTFQLTSSVLWHQTIVNMINDGINKIFEIGPGNVLTKLIKRIDNSIEVHSLNTLEKIEKYGFKLN